MKHKASSIHNNPIINQNIYLLYALYNTSISQRTNNSKTQAQHPKKIKHHIKKADRMSHNISKSKRKNKPYYKHSIYKNIMLISQSQEMKRTETGQKRTLKRTETGQKRTLYTQKPALYKGSRKGSFLSVITVLTSSRSMPLSNSKKFLTVYL